MPLPLTFKDLIRRFALFPTARAFAPKLPLVHNRQKNIVPLPLFLADTNAVIDQDYYPSVKIYVLGKNTLKTAPAREPGSQRTNPTFWQTFFLFFKI